MPRQLLRRENALGKQLAMAGSVVRVVGIGDPRYFGRRCDVPRGRR